LHLDFLLHHVEQLVDHVSVVSSTPNTQYYTCMHVKLTFLIQMYRESIYSV